MVDKEEFSKSKKFSGLKKLFKKSAELDDDEIQLNSTNEDENNKKAENKEKSRNKEESENKKESEN
ncbi:MAG: hypothetical protein LBR24_00210, partial [Methanobrevibacter sp.]|nr:hypothetical protein [Methanobrevibacter sp.]